MSATPVVNPLGNLFSMGTLVPIVVEVGVDAAIINVGTGMILEKGVGFKRSAMISGVLVGTKQFVLPALTSSLLPALMQTTK